MLKVLELFCGAGSFSVNLKTNDIKHEIIGFSDIRESAIDVFCKIHNKQKEENLGDIKKISAKNLEVDLLVFGSPCQSFSRTGNSEGGFKGSNTKSSLMWEAVRIMGECTPGVIVWENVPDAVNKTHINNFLEYKEELEELGYNTYYKVLNAHELGSAQKRKRLFSVSIRKDLDKGKFCFIEKKQEPKKLTEYLSDYDDYFRLDEKTLGELVLGREEDTYKIVNATKQGYLLADNGCAIDTSFPKSKTRRGRVQKQSCMTLLRSQMVAVVQEHKIRYLTPKEYWLLQEMPPELFSVVEESNLSLKDQYDVVGGVINQKHLDVVFCSLKEHMGW